MTVQDTSFAKLGRDILVQELQKGKKHKSMKHIHFKSIYNLPLHCHWQLKMQEQKFSFLHIYMCAALTLSSGRWLFSLWFCSRPENAFSFCLEGPFQLSSEGVGLEKALLSEAFKILGFTDWERWRERERVRWVDRVGAVTPWIKQTVGIFLQF